MLAEAESLQVAAASHDRVVMTTSQRNKHFNLWKYQSTSAACVACLCNWCVVYHANVLVQLCADFMQTIATKLSQHNSLSN